MYDSGSYQYSMSHRSNARWRERLPMHSYVAAVLLSAEYDVESDGRTYASHPLLPGITASGHTFAVCRQRLRHLLESRLQDADDPGDTFPIINGIVPPGSRRSTDTSYRDGSAHAASVS